MLNRENHGVIYKAKSIGGYAGGDIGTYPCESLISELCERLLAVEANRLSGKAGISIGELNIDLKRIIESVQYGSQ